jgi:TonB-linked SusC/RagA family outer membrane protein
MNIKVILNSIIAMQSASKIILITLVTLFSYSIVSIAGVADRTVSGTVKDSNGQAIAGAIVQVKSSTVGATTDEDGRFSLSVPDNATLQISHVSYVTVEVVVGTQSTIDVVLDEGAEMLEELVVVGYGTQKKVNLTGAVDVISNERLSQRPSGNVSQSIRGLSPSLNFSAGSAFQPGADMSVTIRGIGSLNGGSPYVLIDGFPGDMNLLNPDDIESISILKDAAASAIYGARAPYGVILITTKNGKKGAKMHVTYSGNVMINTPQKLPKGLDSRTWAGMLNEAGRNAGGSPVSEATIDRIVAYQNQDWDLLHQLIPNYPEGADITSGAYPNGEAWDNANLNFANNDYWDVWFGSSVNQKHDLSVQGGTEKASYYFSGGFLDQNGILNYGQDDFRRLNLLGKVNIAISDRWDFSWDSRFSQKDRTRSSYWNGGNYGTMFNYLWDWMYPITPIYDGWGNYANLTILYLQSGTERIKNLDYWNNFRTEIRPLKGWKINADFAYNTQDHSTSNTHFSAKAHGTDNSNIIEFATTLPNNLRKQKYSNYYWNTNIYTSYSIDVLDAHHFSIMAGMQFEKGENNSINGYKTYLISESVPSFQTATGTVELSEALAHNATQGYFGRFNYNFKDKYMLEANARYDGTYVFKKGKRWGFFPSVSIGWNIHRESFWAAIEPYVNTLKIKGSWGQLGNQNVNPYTDMELIPLQTGKLNWIFNPNSGRQIGYTSAPSIVNQNLTWETATTKNMGIETSFLKNRLQVDFSVYERTTTNMVGPSEAKPGVLGASPPSTNNATLRTRGWDLSLGWKQNINNNLSWFANVNLSDYTSVVTKYNNSTGTLSTWYEGKTVGEIWGYTVHDLFRTQAELDGYLEKTDLSFLGSRWRTGDTKYEDTNGDGKVNNGKNTVSDHGDLSIIGNDQPRYLFGLTLGASYKGLDFSMLWSGMLKRNVYYGSGGRLFWGLHSNWWDSALHTRNLDYFRDEPGTKYYGVAEGDANINLDAYWPRPYLNGTELNKNTNNPNTRYLVNTAFARMTNIQLGYSLPKKWISKVHLDKVRVFFSGENLLTFTELPVGIDPEAPNGGNLTYGADRIYSFGITITY